MVFAFFSVIAGAGRRQSMMRRPLRGERRLHKRRCRRLNSIEPMSLQTCWPVVPIIGLSNIVPIWLPLIRPAARPHQQHGAE